MKTFSVEIRATYEVEALTHEDAIRAVPAIQAHRIRSTVEYLVRERPQAPAEEDRTKNFETYGLIKPVYSVAEAALILGVSAAQMYAQTANGTIPCVRLGKRQIRIPRSSLVAVFDGKSTGAAIIDKPIRKRSTLSSRALERKQTEATQAGKRTAVAPSKRKEVLSVGEAAGMLHASADRVRRLVADRKIFFTQQGSKILIPKRAVEAFAEGKRPIDVVEENIAFYKNLGGWDADMEDAAKALRKEWK